MVASGKVAGVEKFFFFARTKAKSSTLALIEISVNSSSKRLSAVFKSSVPDGEVVMDLLFSAFKRVVTEEL